MSTEQIAFLVTAIIGVLMIVAGGFLVKIKNGIGYLSDNIGVVLKEMSDVPRAVKKALEDNRLTKEEAEEIVKEINEAGGALKNLIFDKREKKE